MFSRMRAPKDAWGIQPWKFLEPIFGGQNDFGHRVDHGDMVLGLAGWLAGWIIMDVFLDWINWISKPKIPDEKFTASALFKLDQAHESHSFPSSLSSRQENHGTYPRQVVSAFKRLSLSGVQAPAAAACACRVEPKVLFL